jgi:amidase
MTQFTTWKYDGGEDVHTAFALSGEPMYEPVASLYAEKGAQSKASEIAATNVLLRELQKEYMEYWNSTAASTTTGRPVDCIIAPLAPFPAARPSKYDYYGYSVWVNALDYTSVVVPVTTADKNVDVKNENYKPRDEVDQSIYESCKCFESSC